MKICLEKYQGTIGIGALLGGIGSCITAGVAACALHQANSLFDEVLKIQEQAKQISVAVERMDSQLKQQKAMHTYYSSAVLQSPNSTVDQINAALKNISKPSSASYKASAAYLPDNKRPEIAEQLLKAKAPESRIEILEENLVIDKSKQK